MPEPKKARLLNENASSLSPCRLPRPTAKETNLPIKWLINDCNDDPSGKMPISLCVGVDGKSNAQEIGQNLDKLRKLLDVHGLRTTKISSPREAVSVYKESCRMDHIDTDNSLSVSDGKEFLLITFGLHPQQERIEKEYKTFVKNSYCVLLFCQKLHQEYCNPQRIFSPNPSETDESNPDAEDDLQRLFCQIDETLELAKDFQQKKGSGMSSRFVEEHVNTLIELAIKVKGNRFYRKEEWRKEFQRIRVSNSTISNAYIFLLQSCHSMCIKDIYLKFNKDQPKYDRITIYLYDPSIDQGRRPDFFLFLPGLRTVITKGPHELVSEMIESFWTFVVRNGYFATRKLQGVLESKLRSFFLAGITTGKNSNLPLPLKANFVPTFPFSIYLYGRAGSGTFLYLRTQSRIDFFLESILTFPIFL